MINVVISLYYYLLVVRAAYLLEPAEKISGSKNIFIHQGANRNISQRYDCGGDLSHSSIRSGKSGCHCFDVSNLGSVYLFFRCQPQFS